MADKSQPKEKKPGRIAEIRQGYQAIRQLDSKVGLWMALAALATLVVCVGIGLIVGGRWWIYALILGIPLATLAATLVLNQRGNSAMYGALEGKPGAVGATLQGIGKRGWYASEEPIAVDAVRGTKATDMSGAALVYRALGRPGIVLLAEGPKVRAQGLLKAEAKKAGRVAPGVPIQMFYVGDDESAGDVPLKKVSNKLTRMKPILTKEEVSVVNKRLRALGGLRPPIPAGMDPMRARVDRKAMRGK